VPAPGQARKVAILGSLNHVVAHVEQLYGPMPGRQVKPVALVEDNGPIHVIKLSRAAPAARAHWFTVEWLPK
jgi:hypothetical protein